jgi:hypothetical protein
VVCVCADIYLFVIYIYIYIYILSMNFTVMLEELVEKLKYIINLQSWRGELNVRQNKCSFLQLSKIMIENIYTKC